ncbi:hypothetical protein AAG906_002193 [Vitis piasezkii]
MAPRKETGTSKAQGKRPAEPSQQPERTEARRKARYDTALFGSVEDYQRYKTHFAKRKVVPGRNINFSQLQSLGFEGLFIRMGWLPVVTVSEPIFPTLVCAFYSRMTYGLGGSIRTTVRGVEIELADAHGMGKPSAHSLTVPSRVLHHMICSILLPRGGHRDEHHTSASLRPLPHSCLQRRWAFFGRMKLEKAPMTLGLGRRVAGRGHDRDTSRVEEEDEIKEMEDGLDPRRAREREGPSLTFLLHIG